MKPYDRSALDLWEGTAWPAGEVKCWISRQTNI